MMRTLTKRRGFGPCRGALGHRPAGRRGFTLIELIMVVTLIGVLSAIAVPRLRGATTRAHAAHVVADYATIQLAAIQYYTETSGLLPTTQAPGIVPDDIEYLLPDGFTFSYQSVTYRWRRWPVSLPNGQNYAAGLELNSPDETLIAEILAIYGGEVAFGSANRITLII
ncbi:MAG: type II secretion system protein [Longimicrobiales bacterium]